MFPRTLEVLEQVDATAELLQRGFISCTSVRYRDGKRVQSSGEQAKLALLRVSAHDYLFNLRQKHVQAVFADKYNTDAGRPVFYQWELQKFEIDTSLSDGYNVTAELFNSEFGERSLRW